MLNNEMLFGKDALKDIDGLGIESQMSLLNASLEQSPLSIVITNKSGTILYVNKKFTELTGYTLAEAIGKNPRILKSGKHECEYYKDLWTTISKGEIWKGEFFNKKKDGSIYNEHVVIAPVFSKAGKITNYIAMKEDITELKQLLQYKNLLLEEKEMMIKNLKNLKYEAEAANKSKSIFIASMSHEIRTPMNAILGFTDFLLKEGDIKDEYKKMIQMVKNSGVKLLDILNDILDISKIEAGRVSINNISFDVYHMFHELSQIFQPLAEEKGLYLRFKKNSNLPEMIVSDEAKIRQIFFHLISNAIKFTEYGSVDVNIRVSTDGDRKLLYGSVKDTGCGITKGNLDKIFAYFERILEQDDKKYKKGTGLGLAIAKEYVNMLGGDIMVESEVGAGSIFSFYVNIDFKDGHKAIDPDELAVFEKREGRPVIQKNGNLVPKNILENLRKGIISGDSDLILKYINEVERYSKDFSEKIERLTSKFMYDEALNIIDNLINEI